MARYSIFDGGNRRLFPWENDRNSGIDPSYPVRYSAHLTNFHKVLRYHIDFNDDVFSRWMSESVPDGELAVSDELVTHLFGPGTSIQRLALQVKGVPPTEGQNGEPPPVPPTFAIRLENEDGSTLVDLGEQTLDSEGYILLDDAIDAFFPGNGFLVLQLQDGDPSFSCLTIHAALVQLFDDRPCNCDPAPCGAEYPDPDCTLPGLILRSDRAPGTGMAGDNGGGGDGGDSGDGGDGGGAGDGFDG